MPFLMNNSTIKFKARIDYDSNLKTEMDPTDGEGHKKKSGSEVTTKGQIVYNKYNQFDPSFSGDMKNVAGYIVVDQKEIARLIAAGTPLEEGARLTELAGNTTTFRVLEFRPIGHTKMFTTTRGKAESSIQAIYFDNDKEESYGEHSA